MMFFGPAPFFLYVTSSCLPFCSLLARVYTMV